MEIHQIESFLSVVESGSFRAASEKLHKAQSAVSIAIQNLEEVLGVQLFDRSGYRPVLTGQGNSLLPHLKAIHQQLQGVQSHAHFLKTGFEPKISLAVSALWPERSLVEIVQNFNLQFPFTELVIKQEILSADEMLMEEQADLSLGGIFDEKNQFEKRSLGHIRMVTVVGKSHPLAKLKEKPLPTALKQHRQIVVKSTSQKSQRLADVEPGQPQIGVSSLSLKKQLILCGVGWGGLPKHYVQSELKQGTLILVRAKEHPVPITLAWPKKKNLGPCAQFLISALEAKKINKET